MPGSGRVIVPFFKAPMLLTPPQCRRVGVAGVGCSGHRRVGRACEGQPRLPATGRAATPVWGGIPRADRVS